MRRALTAPASPLPHGAGLRREISASSPSPEPASRSPTPNIGATTRVEVPQNVAGVRTLPCPDLGQSSARSPNTGTTPTIARSVMLYRETGRVVIETVVDGSFWCLHDYMASNTLMTSNTLEKRIQTEGYICVSWPHRIQGDEFRKIFSTNMIVDVVLVIPPNPGVDFLVGYRASSCEWIYIRKIIDGLYQFVSSSNWSQVGFVAGVMQGTSDEEYIVAFPLSRRVKSSLLRG